MIFLVLPVPLLLKVIVEYLVNVTERDMLIGAALRRHMCRVFDRKFKQPAQTVMAHAMATS
jgi:hypothetical protein